LDIKGRFSDSVTSVVVRKRFPVAVSIDVTSRCNLRCKHCYFLTQGWREELPFERWLPVLEEWRRRGIRHATWVGGEPLLRGGLIEAGRRFFPLNWVVTNGTFLLPRWKDVSYFVSLDGTKRYNDSLRGRGVYDKVRTNLEVYGGRNLCMAMGINRFNESCVEDFVEEWAGNDGVMGVNLDFYTPLRSDDELVLSFPERDVVVERLRALRREYGDFLLLSERILDLMLSKNCGSVTNNCQVKQAVICLDPMGRRKYPCVMGYQSDCSRCGCIIPYFIQAFFIEMDPETIRTHGRMLARMHIPFTSILRAVIYR